MANDCRRDSPTRMRVSAQGHEHVTNIGVRTHLMRMTVFPVRVSHELESPSIRVDLSHIVIVS